MLLLLLLVVAWLLAGSAARAAEPSGRERREDARRLIFLLEYVGTDYGGAVRDGAVVDPAEYGEVLRFTKQLIQECEARGDGADQVVPGLRELERLIVGRAARPTRSGRPRDGCCRS